MEYQFKLKKPLLSSTPTEPYRTPSAEQIALIDSITERLLVTLAKQLLAGGESREPSGPFTLFELSHEICDLLKLARGRVVMLELTGDTPELIWEEDDLRALRARDVDDLRCAAAGLGTFRGDGAPFMSLMADTPGVAGKGVKSALTGTETNLQFALEQRLSQSGLRRTCVYVRA